MNSDFSEPLNLGQDRMVTINELADIIADVAGIEITKKHIDGPSGRPRPQLRQLKIARGPRLGTARFHSNKGLNEPIPG